MRQPVFVFSKKIGRFKEFLVEPDELNLWRQGAGIFLGHVGPVEGFVVVEKVKHGEVSADISSIFHKHVLQRDQLFISGSFDHSLLNLFDSFLAQLFILHLLQPLEQCMQDHPLSPDFLGHDLGDQNRILQSFAQ